MQVLRTDDARFAGLAGFPFLPRYDVIQDADGTALRVHCVDEGPRGAKPVLLYHGCARSLSAAEKAAYDAPFPDATYQAGALQFPTLVPITPGQASVAENLAAWQVLERFDKPFITAFSDADPVTAGLDKLFQARIAGARGQAHCTLKGGHFVQEDSPDDIAALLHRLVLSA